MLYHVLMPQSDGGFASLDYREDLTEALDALRYWRSSPQEDMAIAKGVNGEPLRWVFWVEGPDRSGRRHTRELALGVYATRRGAQLAMRNYERRGGDAKSYGFKPVRSW